MKFDATVQIFISSVFCGDVLINEVKKVIPLSKHFISYFSLCRTEVNGERKNENEMFSNRMFDLKTNGEKNLFLQTGRVRLWTFEDLDVPHIHINFAAILKFFKF